LYKREKYLIQITLATKFNMKVPFVDLYRIHYSIEKEISNVLNLLIKNSSFIQGKYVTHFEEEFADYIGVNYCVGCANGTDAIELALEGLGITTSDEVIVPVHSWVSTATAVARLGAVPVFIDTLYEEYTINTALIERAITPKTKAIIPVHLYGQVCDMEEIMRIAKQHNLLVIEDCAQAHGAIYKGKRAGSFGDAACFSFYPAKNLGALGDGGAITANNATLAHKLRMLINCGQENKNEIKMIGRNSRLDTLQAAVLSIKLKYLDTWNEQRRETAVHYCELLKDIVHIELPKEAKERKHVYHLFVVKANYRSALTKHLEANEIGYGIHYPFMLNNIFTCDKGFAVAEKYGSKIISLPMFVGINDQEIETVANAIAKLPVKSSF